MKNKRKEAKTSKAYLIIGNKIKPDGLPKIRKEDGRPFGLSILEMEKNLFYGGDLNLQEKDNGKGKKEKGFYWVTTRLLRESGPWYAGCIKSPQDVQKVMQEHLDLENADREYFILLCLNRQGYLNAADVISIGGLSSSIVHPREAFKPAILTSSNSVIFCHNHPSGNTDPSQEDKEVTKRLAEAGTILGIEVLDHVIMGNQELFSFKGEGLL